MLGADAVRRQELAQPRRRALAVGGHHDAVAVAAGARRSWRATRSGSPAAAATPIDVTVATSGPSGAVVIVHAGAVVCDSRRSKGRWSRGKPSSPVRLRRSPRPTSWPAWRRGRPPRPAGRRRGRACGGARRAARAPRRREVEEHLLVLASATAATTPCRRTSGPRPAAPTARGPTARGRRAGRPGPAPRRWASSSRQPKISTRSSDRRWMRWSLTENSVRRSTSSPQRSMRTGRSAVDGNTSTIEPRTATSPRCST